MRAVLAGLLVTTALLAASSGCDVEGGGGQGGSAGSAISERGWSSAGAPGGGQSSEGGGDSNCASLLPLDAPIVPIGVPGLTHIQKITAFGQNVYATGHDGNEPVVVKLVLGDPIANLQQRTMGAGGNLDGLGLAALDATVVMMAPQSGAVRTCDFGAGEKTSCDVPPNDAVFNDIVRVDTGTALLAEITTPRRLARYGTGT